MAQVSCPMQSNRQQLKQNPNGIPDGIPRKTQKEKALINQGFIQYVWRKDRDSNPRRATNPCRFSRPVHLTTLPSFRIAANILKLILLVNMNAFKARLNEHILS